MTHYDDELLHYGVKGMKWGVRRAAKRSARMEKRLPKEQLLKSTNAKQVYKNRSRLSDKELNDRINRIQKEQQLNDLRKRSSKGRNAAKAILGGATAAYTTYTTVKNLSDAAGNLSGLASKIKKQAGSAASALRNLTDWTFNINV